MCEWEREKMSNPDPYHPSAQPNSQAQYGQPYPDVQGGQKRQSREDFLVNFIIIFSRL